MEDFTDPYRRDTISRYLALPRQVIAGSMARTRRSGLSR